MPATTNPTSSAATTSRTSVIRERDPVTSFPLIVPIVRPLAAGCGTRLGAAEEAGLGRAAACAPRLRVDAMPGLSLPSPPVRTLDLPGSVSLSQVLTFIIGPLTAGQSQFDLDSSAGEVQRERHEGQAALCDLACEPVYLLS